METKKLLFVKCLRKYNKIISLGIALITMFFLPFLWNGAGVDAQNIGINATGALPNASAGLDVDFANKGLLIPRVALTQTTSVAPVTSPLTSLLVYNTATVNDVTPGYYYWNGSAWIRFATGTSGWLLTGNAGTTPGTNFIGTTDDEDVVFKRNGVQAGLLNNALVNTSWGIYALNPATTGYWNTANGAYALYSNTTGINNTASGMQALQSNTSGSYNTACGFSAIVWNTIGNFNTAIGWSALYGISGSSVGNNNTASGVQALYQNTGNNNTANGYMAGVNITTGSNNTAIGYNAQVPVAAGNYQIQIGEATTTTFAGVTLGWTLTSDRRLKSDIQPSNLGLDFITKLKPVSYIRINNESKTREYGFIAQDLEETLNVSGVADNGIISKDDKGMYGMRYNDLLSPMVKAIQELNAENEKLKTAIGSFQTKYEEQEKINQELQKQLDELKMLIKK
ncbi:MAG: tail fiber domain-containing protein [Bacteroidota bacterium]